MFCHHGKHPSNEQQSQISDSPQAFAALAGRRLKHFSLETTESINSACKRITLLEWKTSSFIIYILPHCHCFHPLLPLFSFFVQSILHACLYVIDCHVWDHHVLCVQSPAAGSQRKSQNRAWVGWDTCGLLVGLIYDAKSDSALYCDLLSQRPISI